MRHQYLPLICHTPFASHLQVKDQQNYTVDLHLATTSFSGITIIKVRQKNQLTENVELYRAYQIKARSFLYQMIIITYKILRHASLHDTLLHCCHQTLLS